MGKKSKRKQSSRSSESNGTKLAAKKDNKPTLLDETPDNLQYEDPFADEYEKEDFIMSHLEMETNVTGEMFQDLINQRLMKLIVIHLLMLHTNQEIQDKMLRLFTCSHWIEVAEEDY